MVEEVEKKVYSQWRRSRKGGGGGWGRMCACVCACACVHVRVCSATGPHVSFGATAMIASTEMSQ